MAAGVIQGVLAEDHAIPAPDRWVHEFMCDSPPSAAATTGLRLGSSSAEGGSDDECAHIDPFVNRGLGAPKGLHPLEHVQWAQSLEHPLATEAVELEGDLEEAVNLCKEALKARKELLGEEHLDVANSLCTLSEIRLEQGAHEKALENCAQALSIRRSKLGPEHIDVATCLHLAGKIYLVLDRQDDTLQVCWARQRCFTRWRRA